MRTLDKTSSWTKSLIIGVALGIIALVIYAITQAPYASAAVDYTISVYYNAADDEPCRALEWDSNPEVIKGKFDCPAGQKISDMVPDDRVFLQGHPIPDDVYVVGRVAFTDLGERPFIGPNVDAALFTSYAGQRYWVLMHR